VAEFWAKQSVEGKHAKDCDWCDNMANPDSFAPGTTVYIAEVYDCEHCEYWNSRLLPENENAIELYRSAPRNFEGWSGIRIISSSDIRFVFEIYGVPECLRDEYYWKILYFHETLINKISEIREAKNQQARMKK
jgi:hypothetical protein